MEKRVKDELRLILLEFIEEFSQHKESFELRFSQGIFKHGTHAEKGIKRNSGSASLVNGVVISTSMMVQTISYLSQEFLSGRKLFEFIGNNGLWHEPIGEYEASMNTLPSFIGGIAGGLITRAFELNCPKLVIDGDIFERTFAELVSFFDSPVVIYDIYFHLRGIFGEIEEVCVNQDISIIRTDFEMARYFTINYSPQTAYSPIEMYEGDYLMRVRIENPKGFYGKLNSREAQQKEREIVEKWTVLPVLGIPGFFEMGKQVLRTTHWPLAHNVAVGPYGKESGYYGPTGALPQLNIDAVPGLIRAAVVLGKVPVYKELDKKIRYSIEHLTRSKAARSINDRIVELSLAFEYLINTTNSDVTLQLCLKTIKLVYEYNLDETIYPKLKKFYSLRSHVIHGNDRVEANEKNLEVIAFTEDLIRKATLKMIDLSQRYTYKQIDDAMVRSMHIDKGLSEILIDMV